MVFFSFFRPMKRLFSLFVILFLGLITRAQNTDIILGHDLYHYVDRLDIKGVTGTYIPTELKPYGRNDLAEWILATDTSNFSLNERLWHRRMQMLADDSIAFQDRGKGLFKAFYKNRRDLYYVKTKNFQLAVNPSIHFAGGMDRNNIDGRETENLSIYTNSRGLSVRGSFLNKIGFYTEVYDNIIRAPRFIFSNYERTQFLPGRSIHQKIWR